MLRQAVRLHGGIGGAQHLLAYRGQGFKRRVPFHRVAETAAAVARIDRADDTGDEFVMQGAGFDQPLALGRCRIEGYLMGAHMARELLDQLYEFHKFCFTMAIIAWAALDRVRAVWVTLPSWR